MRKAFAFASVARLLCLAVAFTLLTMATGCGSGSIAPCTTCGSKTTPTITWSTPAAIIYGTALSSIQLDAKASVDGTYAYTPASGTVLGAGTQTLYVSFAPTDTADYTSASASVQLTVTQAASIISCPAPAAIIYGTALSSTQLACTASVAGSIVYTLAGNVPAMGAIPPQGTDTLYVSFAPTDTADYTAVTATMSIVVNPAVPTITGGTPYLTSDNFSFAVPNTIDCAGCVTGDILHDASGIFGDVTLDVTGTTLSFSGAWEQGDFEPVCDMEEIEHPGGPFGNEWCLAFLGSASQSTLVRSSATGTIFQDAENKGIYALKTDGTQSLLPISGIAAFPSAIAVDDVTTNMVLMGPDVVYSSSDITPGGIIVFKEDGTRVCALNLGAVPISSVAAKGGYFVVTDPGDNEIGIAGIDCSGYHTVSVPGQPWAVSLASDSAGLHAYVLSRDVCLSKVPCLTKINVATGVQEGQVALPGVTPVSTLRVPGTPGAYQGVWQVQAFSQTSTAAVLFMSDTTNGKVLTVSTDTSGSKDMEISFTTLVPELPIGIAAQETASNATLFVASIVGDGTAVTSLGTIDPTTGYYTPNVGTCQSGILGNIVATPTGIYCAQGSTIKPLQP